MNRSTFFVLLLFLGLLLALGGGHRWGVLTGEKVARQRHFAAAARDIPPPKPAPLVQSAAKTEPRPPRSREEMVRFLEGIMEKGVRSITDSNSMGMGLDVEALDVDLEPLSEEEFQIALELAPQMQSPFGSLALQLGLGRQLMKKDAEKGWAYLQENQPEGMPFHEIWGSASLEQLADINPQIAAQELKKQAEQARAGKDSADEAARLPGAYYSAFNSLFGRLAKSDLPTAFVTAEALADGDRKLVLSKVARNAVKEQREAFLTAVNQVTDPVLKSEWQRETINALASTDNAAAREWLASLALAPEAEEPLAQSLFEAWAYKEPQNALAWAQARFATTEHPALMKKMVQSWARFEPNACGRWLGEQETGPLTDPAREAFARAIVDKDGGSALAWAETISDPARREQCLAELAEKKE